MAEALLSLPICLYNACSGSQMHSPLPLILLTFSSIQHPPPRDSPDGPLVDCTALFFKSHHRPHSRFSTYSRSSGKGILLEFCVNLPLKSFMANYWHYLMTSLSNSPFTTPFGHSPLCSALPAQDGIALSAFALGKSSTNLFL